MPERSREDEFRGSFAKAMELAAIIHKGGVRVELAELQESLRDLALICDKLSACCSSLGDLIGMLELAGENDGQLHLLMRFLESTRK